MPSIFTFTPIGLIGLEDPNTAYKLEDLHARVKKYMGAGLDFAAIEAVYAPPFRHKVYGRIGSKVTEVHNRTNEAIELAAQKALAECETHDDADYHGIADWVRDTDAFSALALGKYSSADSLADKWHDERIG